MEKRNTKQRKAILKCLKENMFHPTAQDLVRLVIENNPTIGQATVYRNINKLVEEGVLIKIPTNNNFRYDINTYTHAHLSCKECGSVIDLFDGDYQKIIKNLERKYQVKIDDTNLIFNGLCEKCKNK